MIQEAPMTRTLRMLAALASSAALITSASGCSLDPNSATEAHIETSKPSTCAIADVSGSTHHARATYVNEFRRIAHEDGLHGSGALCLVVAAGDPTQRPVANANVGPVHRGNSLYSGKEVDDNVTLVANQFDALLRNPGTLRHGSALMEAAAVAATRLKPGDTLVFFSDAFQVSPLVDVHTLDYSEPGIQATLDLLEGKRLLPHLQGVTVRFVNPLYRPEGTSLTAEQLTGVRALWEAWAHRSGARRLQWGVGQT
jgi:hypothetical protein